MDERRQDRQGPTRSRAPPLLLRCRRVTVAQQESPDDDGGEGGPTRLVEVEIGMDWNCETTNTEAEVY